MGPIDPMHRQDQPISKRRKNELDLAARAEHDNSPYLAAWQPDWHASGDGVPAETPHDRLHVHRAFRSRILPDPRDLIVYVPPHYDDTANRDRHYPVLYLHDGQNLFDPATSFIKGRTWQIRESADAAILAGEVEPLIIVGIYNTGDRRLAEYTHERDWQMGGGEADSYGQLLTRELLPWIAKHYRVKPGPEHTGLGGSSLGGLVSLYLGLKHANVFGRLAVLSPSVWWNHKSILGVLADTAPRLSTRPRIWLDVGDHEGRMTLRDAELLAKRLRANGWVDDITLDFEKIPGGTHDEASWSGRVRPLLKFLFPRNRA
jgi:predicted alpha/beta superfamily hydrolase